MCHNSNLTSGGVNLEALQTASSITQNREAWERVLRKLRAGEMPPKSQPRPDPQELKSVIGWIEGEFKRTDTPATARGTERVTVRRLNRAEYNNTVRELLGVDLRPADNFPQDDSGYGFDNVADVLSLSPVLMEKYLAAAEQVARAAVFGPEPIKPTMVKLRSAGPRTNPRLTPRSAYATTGAGPPQAVHVSLRVSGAGAYILRGLFCWPLS